MFRIYSFISSHIQYKYISTYVYVFVSGWKLVKHSGIFHFYKPNNKSDMGKTNRTSILISWCCLREKCKLYHLFSTNNIKYYYIFCTFFHTMLSTNVHNLWVWWSWWWWCWWGVWNDGMEFSVKYSNIHATYIFIVDLHIVLSTCVHWMYQILCGAKASNVCSESENK